MKLFRRRNSVEILHWVSFLISPILLIPGLYVGAHPSSADAADYYGLLFTIGLIHLPPFVGMISLYAPTRYKKDFLYSLSVILYLSTGVAGLLYAVGTLSVVPLAPAFVYLIFGIILGNVFTRARIYKFFTPVDFSLPNFKRSKTS